MSQRIVMRTGEALVEDEAGWSAAEPEVVIGELDGPVGHAIAQLMGDQSKGHSKVFAILNCDVQVRPVTVMVSKVTVKDEKYTNILMGTVQAAIANGVLDAVRAGDIPKEKANDLGIIVSVWLDPAVTKEEIDYEISRHIARPSAKPSPKQCGMNRPSIGYWKIRTRSLTASTRWRSTARSKVEPLAKNSAAGPHKSRGGLLISALRGL